MNLDITYMEINKMNKKKFILTIMIILEIKDSLSILKLGTNRILSLLLGLEWHMPQ